MYSQDENKNFEYRRRLKEKQLKNYFSKEKQSQRIKKKKEYQRKIRDKQFLKNKQKLELIHNGEIELVQIKKFSEKMQEMHKRDEIFYEQIWNEREHYCINCGKYLGKIFKDSEGKLVNLYRYAHIIPKSTYPYLRHYKNNLMLLCLNCHTKFDNSPKEVVKEMKCYNKELIEKLKLLHKELENNKNDIYK